MIEKQPMQADGAGKKGLKTQPEIASRPGGTGESGGGAYPNPHTGKGDKKSSFGGFFGHGGQSHIAYEGPDNPNATTKEE